MNKNMIEAMEGNGEFVGEVRGTDTITHMTIDDRFERIDREELARLRADSAELARARAPVKACTHEFSDNGEFELHCHLCDFHIDATPSRELMDEASQMAFEAGGDNDGGYILTGDEFDQIIAHVVSQAIVEREAAFRAKSVPEGFALVPVEVKRDAERLEWLMESDALIAKLLSSGEQHYRLEWPDTEEFQCYWYKSPRQAIDEAMLAAAQKGDSHE